MRGSRRVCAALAALLALLSVSVTALAEQPLSPTTGLPFDGPYRPILVIINNNVDARPYLSLSEADIVYESIFWGPGHTRYMAVFSDRKPELVGAIRSARPYHAYLRRGWDCPIINYAFSGSDQNDYYSESNGWDRKFLYEATRTGEYVQFLRRISERFPPHNLAANLLKISEQAWPQNEDGTPHEPRRPLFQFSETPTRGEEDANIIKIIYDGLDDFDIYNARGNRILKAGDTEYSLKDFMYNEKTKRYEKSEGGKIVEHTKEVAPQYHPMFVFNVETRQYERWYNGSAQYDGETKARIVASNVIVQYCALSYKNNIASQPIIETTGGGEIHAYIDGRRISGFWRRDSAEAPVEFFDSDGAPLSLMPGKTFIQIVPLEFACIPEPGEEASYRYEQPMRAT